MWTRKTIAELMSVPLIGMIHCRPLPGSPLWGGDLATVRRAAVADAEALATGGAGAVMLENFHDVPFHRGQVPAATVAALATVALAVREAVPDLPLGINVLRNDGVSALGIAAAVDATFVRINILAGAAVTDQGLIQGDAAVLMRERVVLCPQVAVLADLDVKHARPLAPRPPAEEAVDLRRRALADGLILSGVATGAPTSPAMVTEVCGAVPDCPVLVGSGVTPENIRHYPDADAFIIGTALQRPAADGFRSVDVALVERCVAAVTARHRPTKGSRG